MQLIHENKNITILNIYRRDIHIIIQHTNYWGLTYGEFKSQKILDSMVKNAKLEYSWHKVMSKSESYDS